MKRLLTIVLILLQSYLFAQPATKDDYKQEQTFTNSEVEYLNDYLKDKRGTFDFAGKKVAFVTGNRGEKITSKTDYMEAVRDLNLYRKEKVPTTIIFLNKEQKIASGGYDVIISYWVKIWTGPTARRNLLKRLREGLLNVQ